MQTVLATDDVSGLAGSRVEIDLDGLERNIHAIQGALSPECSLMCVVKSNAYGHGLIPVACRAAEAGARWFAVAYLDEAVRVRQALPDVSIVVLGVVGAECVDTLLEQRIIPMIVDEGQGVALARAARQRNRVLPSHVKVDSGMGRLGISWEQANGAIDRLSRQAGLSVRGICSHFATVEPAKPWHAEEQVDRLRQIDWFNRKTVCRHISSGRAFLYHPEWDYDAVRIGLLLFGYGAERPGGRVRTHPILQWKTRVIQVKHVPAHFAVGYYGAYRTPRPTDIVTISVGYADGYPRLVGNRGAVLIRGKRCNVVGRISMNWVTVDAGPRSGVEAGDEVVLMGAQGSESIWASEIAKWAQTIPYEILTDIQAHVPRRYRHG